MVKKEGLLEVEKWLRKEERQLPKGKKRIKDYRDEKTELYVLDVPTLETLYKFSKKGIIKALGGPISSGKEAVIFHGIGAEEEELAIKMYKVSTSNFKVMLEYIIGDPRFEHIKRDRKSIVFTWARKELKNLKRAFDVGVRVPKPIACDKNVLIMEFIGKEGVAAPRLRDVPVEVLELDFDLEELFLRIISSMKIMYERGAMVHADLSEFNILMKGYAEREVAGVNVDKIEIEPVIIDMGQSLLLKHPNADTFFRRDVRNIVTFFNKLGLDCSVEEVMKKMTR
ncbi:serine protein kinase RIO [Methanophagales archaeon]|nr:MAG: serine protein kinase RIO [Methanophagales archaeon]